MTIDEYITLEQVATPEVVAKMNLDKLADRAKRGKIIGEGDDR